LKLVVDLGSTALANSFPRSPAEFAAEARYPLELYFCPACSLVQLLDVVPAEQLFSNYIYVTGTSDTIAAHNLAYARSVVAHLGLGKEDLVVEVASNDGSLLRCFQKHGVRVLGVEPATNIAERAVAAGVPSVNRFFGHDEGRRLREEFGAAKAVIGNNVLAHVDDTLGFLRGARELLADDGRAIFEVPYLGEFVERLEYDTVYHEHLCYFSVTALMHLFAAAGLRIVRIERHPVHGGSLRVFGARDTQVNVHGEDALRFAKKEAAAGWTSLARYERFARDVADNKLALLELLTRLRAERKSVAAYGAPAKGNTLLQYCGITTDLVPYTVDKNPLKVGLFCPGSHLPVLPVDTLLERQPDFVLILAWNFAEEIMRQQAEYARLGGRFILPLPAPKILGQD
jgi:SAM-dependent methyltransferase